MALPPDWVPLGADDQPIAPETGPASAPAQPFTGVGGSVGALAQGVLDTPESVNKMQQKAANAIFGAPPMQIPQPAWLQNLLAREKATGQAYPVERFAGNVLPWLAAPEVKGAKWLGDAVMGGVAGATQPLDPNDPNYWRDLAMQTLTGAGSALGLGQVARGVASRAKVAKDFAESAYNSTLGMYRHIAQEAGDPTLLNRLIPGGAITRETAQKVRSEVGKRLGAVYNDMKFDPNAPGWMSSLNDTYLKIANALPETFRDRWNRVFTDDAVKPAFMADLSGSLANTVPPTPNFTGAPVTGEQLGNLLSHLASEANRFASLAQKDVDGPVYKRMSDGLKAIRHSIQNQIDAENPAAGAIRQRMTSAYHLADTMLDASPAARRGINTARDIVSSWEGKIGKAAYAGNRFADAKNMLDREIERVDRGLPTPTKLDELKRRYVHLPGGLIGYELGRLFGHPLAGMGLGIGTSETLLPYAEGAAAKLGQRPGVVGALGGQASAPAQAMLP